MHVLLASPKPTYIQTYNLSPFAEIQEEDNKGSMVRKQSWEASPAWRDEMAEVT